MVLGNFAVNGWRMSKSIINLDLNHILVAGKIYVYNTHTHTQFAPKITTTNKRNINQFAPVYFNKSLSSNTIFAVINKKNCAYHLNLSQILSFFLSFDKNKKI